MNTWKSGILMIAAYVKWLRENASSENSDIRKGYITALDHLDTAIADTIYGGDFNEGAVDLTFWNTALHNTIKENIRKMQFHPSNMMGEDENKPYFIEFNKE